MQFPTGQRFLNKYRGKTRDLVISLACFLLALCCLISSNIIIQSQEKSIFGGLVSRTTGRTIIENDTTNEEESDNQKVVKDVLLTQLGQSRIDINRKQEIKHSYKIPFDAEIVSINGMVDVLQFGDKANILTILMKNTGSQTWEKSGSSPVSLGTYCCKEDNTDLSPSRISPIEASVRPGDVATFLVPLQFRSRKTCRLGSSILSFRMLVSNVTWFGSHTKTMVIRCNDPNKSESLKEEGDKEILKKMKSKIHQGKTSKYQSMDQSKDQSCGYEIISLTFSSS